MLRLGVSLWIQIAPRITPPALGFLLHSPMRRRYRENVRSWAPLRLVPGLRVLDIGGGTGAWTRTLAEQVAPGGSVYSIELQHGMLQQQVRNLAGIGGSAVQLHQADALDLPFATASFDRAVMVAVLPMLSDKHRALHEARRVLKPGGLLLVSEDWIEPEYVPPSITRRWARQAGFEHLSTHHNLLFYSTVFRSP